MGTIASIHSNITVQKFDQRAVCQKVIDKIVAMVKEIWYCLLLAYRMYLGPQDYHYLDKRYAWEPQSKGLVVMVHGLLAHPSCWDTHIQLIGKEYDVFTPFVPKQGICSLEEAAEPIYQHVKRYAEKYPGKKICVMGHSNGSRVADYIEYKLRQDAPSTPVKVSTIAGVHLGSPVQGYLHWLRLDRCFSTKLSEEMAYESKKAREIFENLKKPLASNVAKRDYEFYAALDDVLVPSLHSSMPTIGKGEKKIVRARVGHCYLVEEVAHQQIESAKRWFA